MTDDRREALLDLYNGAFTADTFVSKIEQLFSPDLAEVERLRALLRRWLDECGAPDAGKAYVLTQDTFDAVGVEDR